MKLMLHFFLATPAHLFRFIDDIRQSMDLLDAFLDSSMIKGIRF